MDDTSFVPVAANPCLDLDRSEIPRETNTSTPRLLFFSISFLPSFLSSFAYPLFLLLLRTISTCRIFVRKELEIFQRFVFESRVKRERERERERMIVDGRSPSNGDPPRGIYKVRARSYLKVRYAIGDISMPNISHKAAPRSPCHIKYYLCPFV